MRHRANCRRRSHIQMHPLLLCLVHTADATRQDSFVSSASAVWTSHYCYCYCKRLVITWLLTAGVRPLSLISRLWLWRQQRQPNDVTTTVNTSLSSSSHHQMRSVYSRGNRIALVPCDHQHFCESLCERRWAATRLYHLSYIAPLTN